MNKGMLTQTADSMGTSSPTREVDWSEVASHWPEDRRKAIDLIECEVRKHVICVCRGRGVNKKDIHEDLIQTAIARLLDPGFVYQGRNQLFAFVRISVRNGLKEDDRRARNIEKYSKIYPLLGLQTAWDDGHSIFEIRDEIEKILNLLDIEHQEVVKLRYLESLSFEEVSVRLGISRTVAFNRLTRGMMILRDILASQA